MLARQLGIARSLLVYYGQIWRHRRLEDFYSQFLSPGDLAFDIGAHVGNRTKAFRNLGARVVAVEPQPDLMGIMRVLFAKDAMVRLVEQAVAKEPGVLNLQISSRYPTVSTCTPSFAEDTSANPNFAKVSWDRHLQVSATSLQELCERHGEPDFIKIDIEGGELDALLGLQFAPKAVSFELLPILSERALACIDALVCLGSYEFRFSPQETMRFASNSWLSPAGMKEAMSQMTSLGPPGDIYARRL